MTFPLTRRYSRDVPATGTTASNYQLIDAATESETVSSISFIPMGSVTGAATNNRAYNVYNRSATGGTTLVGSLTLGSGTNLTDNVARALTLSSTSANLLLTAGQVLEWESIANGSGLADPGGVVVVNTTRTLS